MEKSKECSFCKKKNERLELVLRGLLSELGCGSMFVSKDCGTGKLNVLIAGETAYEFECSCDDE